VTKWKLNILCVTYNCHNPNSFLVLELLCIPWVPAGSSWIIHGFQLDIPHKESSAFDYYLLSPQTQTKGSTVPAT